MTPGFIPQNKYFLVKNNKQEAYRGHQKSNREINRGSENIAQKIKEGRGYVQEPNRELGQTRRMPNHLILRGFRSRRRKKRIDLEKPKILAQPLLKAEGVTLGAEWRTNVLKEV